MFKDYLHLLLCETSVAVLCLLPVVLCFSLLVSRCSAHMKVTVPHLRYELLSYPGLPFVFCVDSWHFLFFSSFFFLARNLVVFKCSSSFSSFSF